MIDITTSIGHESERIIVSILLSITAWSMYGLLGIMRLSFIGIYFELETNRISKNIRFSALCLKYPSKHWAKSNVREMLSKALYGSTSSALQESILMLASPRFFSSSNVE